VRARDLARHSSLLSGAVIPAQAGTHFDLAVFVETCRPYPGRFSARCRGRVTFSFQSQRESNHCAAGAARTAKPARRAKGRMPGVKRRALPRSELTRELVRFAGIFRVGIPESSSGQALPPSENGAHPWAPPSGSAKVRGQVAVESTTTNACRPCCAKPRYNSSAAPPAQCTNVTGTPCACNTAAICRCRAWKCSKRRASASASMSASGR